jgi:hypothetical protein
MLHSLLVRRVVLQHNMLVCYASCSLCTMCLASSWHGVLHKTDIMHCSSHTLHAVCFAKSGCSYLYSDVGATLQLQHAL